MNNIRDNIKDIRRRIADAAEGCGRRPGEITLVAIGKTFGGELIEEAYRAGISDFGENYVQEAIQKITGLDIKPRWHFIGHLQKNKVRPVVKHFQTIDSVDSPALLERVNRIAGEEGRHTEVLLQVNLVGEESKFGFEPAEVEPAIEKAAAFRNVDIRGLMLLPPFYEKPERNRINFRRLRKMAEEIDKRGFLNWENRYLSMGMTDDFEIAIEEGSNAVRIGRAIFGQRRR